MCNKLVLVIGLNVLIQALHYYAGFKFNNRQQCHRFSSWERNKYQLSNLPLNPFRIFIKDEVFELIFFRCGRCRSCWRTYLFGMAGCWPDANSSWSWSTNFKTHAAFMDKFYQIFVRTKIEVTLILNLSNLRNYCEKYALLVYEIYII